MILRALIFDFDGLILDTETPEFQVWQDIYAEYGLELPASEWLKIVGSYGQSSFDPARHLVDTLGGGLDPVALRQRHRSESAVITADQAIRPGVQELLQQASRLAIMLAIASSSPHDWVDEHLSRLGLLGSFDKIICADDVEPGRTKPYPDLFLKALQALNVQPSEAIIFEDSLNGVRAAKAAGVFVVAVPNPLTAMLGVDGADMTIPSLRDFHLADFLGR
jgi:HAD superfamily hydrolase (TIGR01509 family)